MVKSRVLQCNQHKTSLQAHLVAMTSSRHFLLLRLDLLRSHHQAPRRFTPHTSSLPTRTRLLPRTIKGLLNCRLSSHSVRYTNTKDTSNLYQSKLEAFTTMDKSRVEVSTTIVTETRVIEAQEVNEASEEGWVNTEMREDVSVRNSLQSATLYQAGSETKHTSFKASILGAPILTAVRTINHVL